MSDVLCSRCGRVLAVAFHIVTGVYCDEGCARAANEGRRKVRDDPRAE